MKGLGPQGYTRVLFSTLVLGQVILMLGVLRVCGARCLGAAKGKPRLSMSLI